MDHRQPERVGEFALGQREEALVRGGERRRLEPCLHLAKEVGDTLVGGTAAHADHPLLGDSGARRHVAPEHAGQVGVLIDQASQGHVRDVDHRYPGQCPHRRTGALQQEFLVVQDVAGNEDRQVLLLAG